MVRSLAVLAFVAGVGAGAIYLAQRPTVARGDVIGADLVGQNKWRGWKVMRCPSEIPIGIEGARKFRCHLELTDGDVAELEVGLGRDGRYEMRVLSESTASHRHVPASGDPWGD